MQYQSPPGAALDSTLAPHTAAQPYSLRRRQEAAGGGGGEGGEAQSGDSTCCCSQTDKVRWQPGESLGATQ